MQHASLQPAAAAAATPPRPRNPVLRAALASMLAIAAFGTGAQASDTAAVLVLDASGSMWGQLEGGVTKVEVARQVLAEYFHSRDGDQPLAVLAYGHRRRGDCADIELVAPSGIHDAGALAQRLAGIHPRGMTPIAASLRMAAAQIPPTAERADIILVTDGLETCDADPCAVAAELAAQGLSIRAHVVGFGLTVDEAQALACITEQTGGLLLRPQSGSELAAALANIAELPSDPPPKPTPEAAFDIGDKAEAGFSYALRWRGEARNVDSAGFVPAGASRAPSSPEFGVIGGTATQPNNPATRRAPATPGAYELVLVADGAVIARQPIEVVAPNMGFEAVGSVAPGARVAFRFRGPERQGERIVIAHPDDPPQAMQGAWAYALHRKGSTRLRVPEQPGEYEVRYLDAKRTSVLFSRRFGVGIPFEDSDQTTRDELEERASQATEPGVPEPDDAPLQ